MKNLMKFAVAVMAALVLMSSAKTAEARKISQKMTRKEYKFSGVVTKEKFHQVATKDWKRPYVFIRGKVKIDGDFYETVNWLRMNDTVWGYKYEVGKIHDGTVKIEACPYALWDDANYNTKTIRKYAKMGAKKWRAIEQLRKEFDAGLAELKQKMAAEGKELTQVDRAYYACHFVDSRMSYGGGTGGYKFYTAMAKGQARGTCTMYKSMHVSAMAAAGVKCIGSAETYDHAMAWFRADNGKRVIIDNDTCIDDVEIIAKKTYEPTTWEEYYASVKDEFEDAVEARGAWWGITTVEELKADYEEIEINKQKEVEEFNAKYHCSVEEYFKYDLTHEHGSYWKDNGKKAGYYYGSISKKNKIHFSKGGGNSDEGGFLFYNTTNAYIGA